MGGCARRYCWTTECVAVDDVLWRVDGSNVVLTAKRVTPTITATSARRPKKRGARSQGFFAALLGPTARRTRPGAIIVRRSRRGEKARWRAASTRRALRSASAHSAHDDACVSRATRSLALSRSAKARYAT